MIQKKTWKDFINNLSTSQASTIRDSYNNLSSKLTKLSDNELANIEEVFANMSNLLGVPVDEDSIVADYSEWKDMTIWISSYKPFTRVTYFYKLFFDLDRYIDAYSMLLTNDGFAKTFSRSGSINGSSESSSKNKDYNSETPQVSSNDQLLDNLEYLSSASKTFNDTTATSSQTDNVTESSKSWEDQKKNMELVYFRDICSYIMEIPYLLYDYYALDTYPYPDAIERFYDNLKETYE